MMTESGQASSAALTEDFLTSGVWTYSRLGGIVYSDELRLLRGGKITGYSHSNEASWSLQEGRLCFLSAAGSVSTRFDEEIVEGDRAQLTLRGTAAGGRIVHCLSRRASNTPAERTDTTRFALAKKIEAFGWSIGRHSYGVPDVFEAHMARLRIGSFCSIARGVSIALGDHKIGNVSTYPFQRLSRHWPEAADQGTDHVTKGDVTIGSDVWIGAHAFIGSGVTIGSGAVIGAHSLFVKDVPPYALAVGNPARVVRYRFPADVVAALLAIAWWDWNDEDIRAQMPLILSEDVRGFIRVAQQLRGLEALPAAPPDAGTDDAPEITSATALANAPST
jgi:acetyltransferase-like isoleucine patch superfamily enzyme